MKVTELVIPGVMLVEPQVFGDARGFFIEAWERNRYKSHAMPAAFVQDNVSGSARGVLRGLHLQNPHAQTKLVTVVQGAVLDVVVDVRVGSPTFGRWVSAELTADNHHQLYIPRGCAHGFCVLSEWAVFSYKCDETYHPQSELGVRYDDPDIGVQWPQLDFSLSAKDKQYPCLRDIDKDKLPRFEQP